MLNQKLLNSLIVRGISCLSLGILLASCNTQANIPEEQNSSQEQNTTEEVNQPEQKTSCPMESHNWQASIDRVTEDEPRLNISGEVDLPTPGYQVEWQPGILDRKNPPTQRLSISFIPPEGAVIQVITPTEVSFTMPSKILKYSSVAIYCGDKLLADITNVMLNE